MLKHCYHWIQKRSLDIFFITKWMNNLSIIMIVILLEQLSSNYGWLAKMPKINQFVDVTYYLYLCIPTICHFVRSVHVQSLKQNWRRKNENDTWYFSYAEVKLKWIRNPWKWNNRRNLFRLERRMFIYSLLFHEMIFLPSFYFVSRLIFLLFHFTSFSTY